MINKIGTFLIINIILFNCMIEIGLAENRVDGAAIEKEEIEEESGSIKLNKIVVTATRYDKSFFETPVPITVIDREDIRENSPMNVGDLLKEVAGVEIHHDYTPGICKVRIRGLHANRVVVLIDGIRWNSQISSMSGGTLLNAMDVNQLERVEIIHGPASVLYGSGAIGGVVNLITRKPEKQIRPYMDFNLKTSYDSANDLKTGGLSMIGGYKKLDIMAGGSVRKAEDMDTPDGELAHSSFSDGNIDFYSRYAAGGGQSVALAGHCFRARDIESPHAGMGDIVVIVDTPRLNRDFFSLTYRAEEMTSYLSLFQFNCHYQREEMEFINRNSMGASSTMTLDGALQTETCSVHAHGVLYYNVLFPQVVTIGTDYYRDESKMPMTITSSGCPDEEVSMVDGSYDSIAVYTQDEAELLKDLRFTLGCRYDWYYGRSNMSDEESALWSISGGAGLLYFITDFLNVGASVSSAFRAPVLEELFFSGPVMGGIFLKGNPDLEPEKSLNFETGLKIRHSRIAGGITAYLNKFDDYIVMCDSDTPGVATFKNVSKTEIRGIEGTLDLSVTKCWSAFSTVGYTWGKDLTEDDPLEGMPPLKIFLGLRYNKQRLPWLNWRFYSEITARIYDEQERIPHDWSDKQKTPAFSIYDFRMGFDTQERGIFENISFVFAIENLSDRKYRSFPVLYMMGWDDSLVQPGRNYKFSLNCRI